MQPLFLLYGHDQMVHNENFILLYDLHSDKLLYMLLLLQGFNFRACISAKLMQIFLSCYSLIMINI